MGDETFTDIARQAGVTNDQFSKGVTVGDYDNDGDLDIFVSNVGKCRLYQNDGSAKFVDVATEAGVIGEPGYNFAPWFFDFNNDGWLDIFICGYVAKLSDFMLDAKGEPHKAALPHLYINQKDGTFVDIAKQAGLDHAWLPMGANYGDIDNDGWLDVYFATGDPRLEILVPNILLKNNEGKRFLNATFGSGLGHLQKGHGVAFADFDHDGDQDLYNQLGGFYPNDKFRNAFFLNPGNENHFLELELVGTESNRDGIGTRITVEIRTPDGGGRKIHRAVGSLSSFGGSPLGRQEIGLGNAASIGKLTIRWPAGDTTSFEDTPLDSRLQITEGSRGVYAFKPRANRFLPSNPVKRVNQRPGRVQQVWNPHRDDSHFLRRDGQIGGGVRRVHRDGTSHDRCNQPGGKERKMPILRRIALFRRDGYDCASDETSSREPMDVRFVFDRIFFIDGEGAS